MILIRVDVRQLELQFEMFPVEAVIGVACDMDKRYEYRSSWEMMCSISPI